MKTSTAILPLLLFLLAADVSATRAVPAEIQFEQPNAVSFFGFKEGDDRFNYAYTSTSPEYLIVQRADDYWVYYVVSGMTLLESTARVGIDAVPPGVATLVHVPLLPSAPTPSPPAGGSPPPQPAAPPMQPFEDLLVLVVGFNNIAPVYPAATWDPIIFGPAPSVADYYAQASHGAFTFVRAPESQGIGGDGIVYVNLATPHPNPGATIGDPNRQIVSSALSAADPFVNFQLFDANMDGIISSNELHLLVIVAGEEEAIAATPLPGVWAHHWVLGTSVPAPTLDGVTVGSTGYAQVGEQHVGGLPATLGVICHELGHDFGLPDLYDTDLSSWGIGYWGLMGAGNWGFVGSGRLGSSPVMLCAWSRVYLGFAQAIPISLPGGTFAVTETVVPGTGIYRVSPTAAPPTEYFLIENRELTSYDAGLGGWFTAAGGTGGLNGGLAIWHIDDTQVNNDNETRKWVDLEEANEGLVGGSQLDTLINGALRTQLFYAGHVTMFNDGTTPSHRLYSGTPANVQLSGVSVAGSVMQFTVGGGGLPPPPMPSCVVAAPAAGSLQAGSVGITFSGGDTTMMPVSTFFDFSTDAGVSFFPAAADPMSLVVNPDPPRPTPFTGVTFLWDTMFDAVGLMGPQPVIFRLNVNNGITAGTCQVSFMVDNTTLCTGICGDCDLNGVGPNILDALTAAQIGVGILFPSSPQQQGCCDPNSSLGIDVLDALIMAQADVGLPVTLVCP